MFAAHLLIANFHCAYIYLYSMISTEHVPAHVMSVVVHNAVHTPYYRVYVVSEQHTCIRLSTTNSCSGVFSPGSAAAVAQAQTSSTKTTIGGTSQVVVYTLIQLNNSAA